MALTYTLIISETEPEIVPHAFWIRPSDGQFSVCIAAWTAIISIGEAVTGATEGRSTGTLIAQDETPAGTVGQLWHNTVTDSLYVYLNDWVAYIGG